LIFSLIARLKRSDKVQLMDSTVLANIVLALHLIPIAWIDFQRLIIPNILNLSLAICGLAVSVAMLDKTLVNVLLAGGLTLASISSWSKSRRSCMTSPTRICSNILTWRDSISAR
jgi:hypothetical protein